MVALIKEKMKKKKLSINFLKIINSRYKDDSDTLVEDGGKPKVQYGVEFTFDADARVAITLFCQAFEEFSNGMPVYVSLHNLSTHPSKLHPAFSSLTFCQNSANNGFIFLPVCLYFHTSHT